MLLLYTPFITSRLEYILHFFWPGEVEITTSEAEYANSNLVRLNYSETVLLPDECRIEPCGLLSEKDIQAQKIKMGKWDELPVFFCTDGSIPFDIFSAAFYLLSRYEEYLPYREDAYGRYAHLNSLAFRENFLQLPLVDLWKKKLDTFLQQHFPYYTPLPENSFYLPSFDIDMAYGYRHKGFLRNTGGALKDVLHGRIKELAERMAVLAGYAPDPWDNYAYLDEAIGKYSFKPVYFFPVAEKVGKYDKNLSPENPYFRQCIQSLASRYTIGLHPSWQSGDKEDLLQKEKQTLEDITGTTITHSRQHYIRMLIPETYNRLIRLGITDDYSMGYGSINGFRASTSRPFFWYNLKTEMATRLCIHPFCYMDANSFYEQKYTPRQALEELRHYDRVTKTTNGQFITIMHNNFFSRLSPFKEWMEMFAAFWEERIKA